MIEETQARKVNKVFRVLEACQDLEANLVLGAIRVKEAILVCRGLKDLAETPELKDGLGNSFFMVYLLNPATRNESLAGHVF